MTDEPKTTDPVPERARIEASPPAKRLDALPVLYLVGFVILASALIYLWKHPGAPRSAALDAVRMDTMRQQIETLAAQVKTLQDRAVPDVGPLEQRVGALERRPEAPSGLPLAAMALVEARVAAVEGRPLPAPVDLRPLDERVGALERRPPVDLRPLETRLGALEAKPPVDLKPVEQRVGVLEAKPPVDLKPMEQRIGALEAKPPVDLKPLEARIDAVDSKPPVDLRPLTARVAAVEAKPPVDLAPLGQRVDALTKKETDDVAALGTQLGARLDGLEASGKQTAAGLAAVTERAQLAGRLQAMSAALAAGQRLGDVPGAPPALARFAHDAPPTEAGLRLSFDQAAAAAHEASQPDLTGDKPFIDRVWTRAQQAVTVRQGAKIIVGDPIGGIIEAARHSLDAGDLQGAVTTLNALTGAAKAAMSGWVGQAQALLDARTAIGTLASRG